ncbi:MAG: gamma-glutamyltransferase [Pseudomonadota bacterium]|nr:gamma-glutamyltransferase [Pseudomonadota bacterium]
MTRRSRILLCRLGVVLIGFCLLPGAFGRIPPPPEAASGWANKTMAEAEEFMIVAAHPAASEAGYAVLRNGGTAMDAAVAAQMVLNLVEPQSSGIGGGAFLLYWDAAAQRLYSLDGRETAPAAVTPDYFLDAQGKPKKWWERVIGGGSVAVPGTLLLLETAHKAFGRMAWSRLLAPATVLADSGFPVSSRLAGAIEGAREKGLTRFPATRDYFFHADGSPLAAGEILRNPAFAKTLRWIAEQGSAPFYHGAIARDIVAAVRGATDAKTDAITGATVDNRGGWMTLDDLAAYHVSYRMPVCTEYRGHDVCGMGPPSSGGLTVAQILGLLSHFDLRGMGYGIDGVHLFAEAARLAFADRARYMADSDFAPMPLPGLIDPVYLTIRAQQIRLDRAMEKAEAGNPAWGTAPVAYAPDAAPELPGTSHLSIADRYGNVLSMTTTIETGFGSRLMVDGFLLNNELTDFSPVPERDGRSVANRIEGGKRPRSSMAPTIVFSPEGRPVLAVGSPGGSRIINYVAKTLIAMIDWGMDVQQAVGLPHFSSRGGPLELEAEKGIGVWSGALAARGHEVEQREMNSGLHAIYLPFPGRLLGGADPRREGVALGD